MNNKKKNSFYIFSFLKMALLSSINSLMPLPVLTFDLFF